MRKQVILWLLLFSAIGVRADVAITANVKTLLKSNVVSRGYFQVALVGCSQGPTVNGVVLDQNPESNRFSVDASGNVTFNLYRNDTEINCAGAFSSVYEISFWSGGKKVWLKRYRFTSASADLSTYAEYLPDPPSPVANYAVRNGGNAFTGTQDFSGATLVGLSTTKPRRFLPAGTMDGANKDFVFGAFPTDHAEFALFWNGVQLTEGDDYTVSGTTVTMTKAPKSGDHLVAYF